ncbi:hypothetical protein, partial [Vibrio vulnificus]|uniref:hypothetical protein n=1 Tax=Vibrio vulnificus TaxID=672 RepID=UPI003F51465F
MSAKTDKHQTYDLWRQTLTNAALRGECRINQVSANQFHHQNSLQTKNATRHESLLNALLCLSLKGLSLRYQELNSTYLCKPKPDAKKLN